MSKQKYPVKAVVGTDGSVRGNSHVKTNGYSHIKANQRRDQRRREADERQAKYDAFTTAEKITLAQSRGGSKRELDRLSTVKPTAVKVVTPAPVVEQKPAKRQSKKKVVEAAKIERPSKS